MSLVSWPPQPDNDVMNLVSTHLHPPAGTPTDTTPRRVRNVTFPNLHRRPRLEPLRRRDILATPSELAMRSVHGVHGFHR